MRAHRRTGELLGHLVAEHEAELERFVQADVRTLRSGRERFSGVAAIKLGGTAS
jgi:hypothetical protein